MITEELFRYIVSSVPDSVIILDERGDIIYFNEAAKSIFVFNNEDINRGNPDKIILPPELHEKFKTGFTEFNKSGTCNILWKTEELTVSLMGRSSLPVELSISPIIINGNRNTIAILRDITERRKSEIEIEKLNVLIDHDITERFVTEQKMSDQNEFLNNFVESLSYPFYVIDCVTYEIILSNSAGAVNIKSNGARCYEVSHNFDSPCWGMTIFAPFLN